MALLSALCQGPGQLERYINSRKPSRQRPQVDGIRTAVVRTVEDSFAGHAQAQMQVRAARRLPLLPKRLAPCSPCPDSEEHDLQQTGPHRTLIQPCLRLVTARNAACCATAQQRCRRLALAVSSWWLTLPPPTSDICAPPQQGSTYMAVALDGLSDADFYVRLDNTIDHVTRSERLAFAEDLSHDLVSEGLYYDLKLGQKRIHGVNGSRFDEDGEEYYAPDFDVVFARSASHAPLPPRRRRLPPAVQQVCCFLRLLPGVYTNLAQPQSSALIDWVEAECAAQRSECQVLWCWRADADLMLHCAHSAAGCSCSRRMQLCVVQPLLCYKLTLTCHPCPHNTRREHAQAAVPRARPAVRRAAARL